MLLECGLISLLAQQKLQQVGMLNCREYLLLMVRYQALVAEWVDISVWGLPPSILKSERLSDLSEVIQRSLNPNLDLCHSPQFVSLPPRGN